MPFYFKELQQRRKKESLDVFVSAGVTEQEFRGRTRRLLSVYLLITLQSVVLHPDLGDIPDASAPCKNRREQLKQHHLNEYVIQKMSSTVTDLWRPLFIVSLFTWYKVHVCHPTTQGCITKLLQSLYTTRKTRII